VDNRRAQPAVRSHVESIRSAVERAVDQLANDPEAGVGPNATEEQLRELAERVHTRSAVGDALGRDRRQDRALALRNVIARSSSQVSSSRESFHRPESVSPSSENRPSNRCEKPGSSRAIRSTPSSLLTS
jgi:hypothetical protein